MAKAKGQQAADNKNKLALAVLAAAVAVLVLWFVVSAVRDADVHDAKSPDAYVDLTLAEAMSKADDAGVEYRVVSRDGESFPMTMDLREDRVNFTVEDNTVTAAEFY